MAIAKKIITNIDIAMEKLGSSDTAGRNVK